MSARPRVARHQNRQERRRALHALGTAFILALIATQPATSQLPGDRGTVVVSVLAAGGGPVPFADFMIEGGRIGLADDKGRFTVTGRLGDTLRVRVRRIGFSSGVMQVPLARETDSVALTLSALALRLSGMSIKSTLCPGPNSSPDTSLIRVVEQLRMNAERGRLLAEMKPHVVIVERQLGNRNARGKVNLLQVDTTELESSPVGRYSPGGVIVPSRTGDRRALQRMPNEGRIAPGPLF